MAWGMGRQPPGGRRTAQRSSADTRGGQSSPARTWKPKMRCRVEKVRGSWPSAAALSRAATLSLLLSRRC